MIRDYNLSHKYHQYDAKFGDEKLDLKQPIPRDRDPEVAVVGEKLEYHGVHYKKGQPIYEGGDKKLLYKDERESWDDDGF